ncbi:MAG: hypothetical protein ACYCZW_00555 [Minisyncoccota bacterium]
MVVTEIDAVTVSSVVLWLGHTFIVSWRGDLMQDSLHPRAYATGNFRGLKPKIIIIGEAPSRHLNYYGGYNTITQNSAGDIIFECSEKRVDIFVSEIEYSVDFLHYDYRDGEGYYLGTLVLS